MAKKTIKRSSKNKDKYTASRSDINQMRWAAIAGCALALIIIVLNYVDLPVSTKEDDKYLCDCATAPISPRKNPKFNDINPEQLPHAKTNGLSRPIADMNDWKLRKKRILSQDSLVRIRNNRYYNIRPLTHSIPYLTPEAAELLDEIGKNFQKNLKAAGLPKYKYQISSLTRTVEFQKQLTRINTNATPNETCHYFGTTFDIAYDKYDRRRKTIQDETAESILSETLRQLRSRCQLMIIKESSNKCYHITVVKKKR